MCDGRYNCNADDDIYLAYNSQVTPHAVVVQNYRSNTEIADLMGRSFADVHFADTAGAGLTTGLIGFPFDSTRVILVRATAGNVYKLGDPVESGPTEKDSVRFNTARLN